jgi:hypothetical protein
MSYPINYPTPQGANIQIFNVGGATSDWVKPQGASFVWFTLIGAGGAGGRGAGNGTADGGGGGSGAVTNCMVPAFLIPDVLQVSVGRGGIDGQGAATSDGTDTTVNYVSKSTYLLLQASAGKSGTNGVQSTAGSGGPGGAASASNYFSCMGLFQSVAGQIGDSGALDTVSGTTFLSGGNATSTRTSNYGYSVPQNTNGYFQFQPIIVGVGAPTSTFASTGANNPSRTSTSHFGCGGGGGTGSGTGNLTYGSRGGDGLVVIITW